MLAFWLGRFGLTILAVPVSLRFLKHLLVFKLLVTETRSPCFSRLAKQKALEDAEMSSPTGTALSPLSVPPPAPSDRKGG